jgi:hypothetical protein
MDGLAAAEGVDPECGNGVGRGGGMQWSMVTWTGASPNQEFTVHASMYGKACLRHGRRLRRAPARHNMLRLSSFINLRLLARFP